LPVGRKNGLMLPIGGGYPFNAGQLEYDHRYSKCPEDPFLAALTSGV
jgi:hypothetical protein